jgi:hypothetical protein
LKGRDYKYDVEGKLYLNDSFLYASYPPRHNTTQMHMNIDYEKVKLLEVELEQFKETFKQQPTDLLLEKDKRILDFKKEIETKNGIILNLSSTIEGLNTNIGLLTERTREQNIIIQSLQEKVVHQLLPSQEVSKSTPVKKVVLIDKLLIGVAILASVAILAFVATMLFAYFSK